MKKRTKALSVFLSIIIAFTSLPIWSISALGGNSVMNFETKIENLTTEYLSEPIGIDTEKVRFGWSMTSNVIGEKQIAYQIKVFSENGNTVWDSGKTKSDKSVGIVCPVKLEEATIYTWEVTVWNELGDTFKNTSSFETGVTNCEEWKNAEFIRMNMSRSAPIFRTKKKLQSGNVKKARLYITALGAYQAYVNGNQVGEWTEDGNLIYHHMNPGYGNGNVSLGYQTYDITPFLSNLESIAVSVEAGTGWYNGMWNVGSSQPAIKALVVITYDDDTEQIIKTNTTDWKGTLKSGIVANGIYYGEDYNACLAESLRDYTQVGFDDSGWINAQNNTTNEQCNPQYIETIFNGNISARFVKIDVAEVGPALYDDKENRLQIMELELLDGENNIVSGIAPTISNNFEAGAQWQAVNMTDGDYGNESDSGYTSDILGHSKETLTLSEPITITFDLTSQKQFSSLKIYPRITKESISSGICVNYPKTYTVSISDDGNEWHKIKTVNNGLVEQEKNSENMQMSTTSYDGEIRAQVGLVGKFTAEYEQEPVSAYIYKGTKENSEYAGGEVDIIKTFDSSNIFESGIKLQKGETLVVNMGQNLTAVPNICFSANRGTKVTMRFAEMLNDGSAVGDGATQADGPKGSIYQKSLRNARSQATYIFAGNGLEIYQPTMSFFGYQYVEITATDDIEIFGLVSKGISSVSKQTGSIETNNENVNKLFNNVLYGQLSNYYTTPTDCNQRDERLSWTGDTQAFAQTAVYNFSSFAFLNDMQDIFSENADILGYVPAVTDDLSGFFSNWAAGWSDVLVILPWTLYLQTGDTSILEENWDIMNNYLSFLEERERSRNLSWIPDNSRNFGDWLSFQGTSVEVIYDYYYGYINKLMAEMADILGETDDKERYNNKFETIKKAFLKEHVTFIFGNLVIKSGKGDKNNQFMYDAGKGGVWENNSQTALLWMLKLGFYKNDKMKEAAEKLLIENIQNKNPDCDSIRANYGENTLAVGFLGSNIIAPVLTDVGYGNISYDLLLQDQQPSWLFEVKAGSTTIWERWNSYTPGVGFGDSEMNSFNHYAYGSIAEWMYRYMAGIASDENNAGFKNIILQPTLDTGEKYNSEERISHVKASYDSVYGEIRTEWNSSNGKLTSYIVKIPANTTATLYLPVNETIVSTFETIPGVIVNGMDIHNGQEILELTLVSGEYEFRVNDNKLTVAYGENYVINPNIELPTISTDGETDQECDCVCHKDRIMKVVYAIVRVFWKLFKINPACDCAIAHY